MRGFTSSFAVLVALCGGWGSAVDAMAGSVDPTTASHGCGSSFNDTTAAASMQPPWHRNVRPPTCGCGPPVGCDPCAAVPCDPCCEETCRPQKPCLPRLHAWFCGGFLLSPPPPQLPRCPRCGCHIPGGF